MGHVTRALLPELRRVSPHCCTVITEDGRRIPHLKNNRHSIWMARLRRRTIRGLQERTTLPMLRWLTGNYDVYNYIGLALRPRVPNRRLILSLHDLGGELWADEGAYPKWAAEVLSRAARIITVSRFIKSELCSHFSLPEIRVEVVYN